MIARRRPAGFVGVGRKKHSACTFSLVTTKAGASFAANAEQRFWSCALSRQRLSRHMSSSVTSHQSPTRTTPYQGDLSAEALAGCIARDGEEGRDDAVERHGSNQRPDGPRQTSKSDPTRLRTFERTRRSALPERGVARRSSQLARGARSVDWDSCPRTLTSGDLKFRSRYDGRDTLAL